MRKLSLLITVVSLAFSFQSIATDIKETQSIKSSKKWQFSAPPKPKFCENWPVEEKINYFSGTKRIYEVEKKSWESYIGKFCQFKFKLGGSESQLALQKDLLENVRWGSYLYARETYKLDPEGILLKYTEKGDRHPNSSIFFDPAFQENIEFHLACAAFMYDWHAQMLEEIFQAAHNEIEVCRANAYHLPLIKSNRLGNLGKGVRVVVWDNFAKPKSSSQILYSTRLNCKIPSDVLKSACIKSVSQYDVNVGSHGLHVAGLIVDDEVGVAPNAQIIPVNASFLGNEAGLGVPDSQAKFKKSAKEILKNDHGAKIINCSFEFRDDSHYGGGGATIPFLNKLCEAHIVVIAAMNKGEVVHHTIRKALEGHEAVRKHLFIASNVMPDGKSLNPKSNFFGQWVRDENVRSHNRILSKAGIAAPGTEIISTIPQNGPKSFGVKTGTSMAAPLVSGLLARLMSDFPEATITEIAQLVREGANREGCLGDEWKFGMGLIDVDRTYELAHEKFHK